MSGEHLFVLIGEHLGHSYSKEIHSMLTDDAYRYELIELIPATVMSGVTPVVPPVRMQDAIKSTDVKKEKVG